MLAGEREELSASLRNLAIALGEVATFVQENREHPRPQHHRPQPGRQGAGQAARRARRDPRGRPARAQQPGADLQPAGRHARHPRQPRRARQPDRVRPGARSCAASLSQADKRGGSCATSIKHERCRGAGAARRPPAAPAGRAVRPDPRRSRGGDADDALRRRGHRRLLLGAAAARAPATSTSTSCRCPAAPTSATTRSRSRWSSRDVLDLVPQSTVKVNDVSVGKVTDVDARRLPRRGHARAAATTSSCPTTRSPRSARPACWARSSSRCAPPTTGASAEPLERRRRHPARAHRPQPGGRGGARRAEPAAQRRRRRPAEDDRPASSTSRSRAARTTRSRCSSQVDTFMGQLDENKADIVDAIESLNRLAVSVNEQQRDHRRRARGAAQRARPRIDRQRDDLVKMLEALDRARRRRGPGDPGVQGRHHRLARGSSTRC